jgi:hypothetical protein
LFLEISSHTHRI